MEHVLRDRGIIEVIAGIALLAIVITMFMSLAGPLVVIALILIAAYGIYQLIRYLYRRMDKKIRESKFDEEGRRYTKISVLEVKDSDKDGENREDNAS